MTPTTDPNAAVPAFRKKAYDESLISAAKGHAAGILCVAPDGDILLLRRAPDEPNFGGHWALPGGGVDAGETPEAGAVREAKEEIGLDADPTAFKDLHKAITPTGLAFHTFAMPVKEKFTPTLNDEHTGYAWASMDMVPRPLHPAVDALLKDRIGVAEDMTPEDWKGLRDGFLKWTAEEAKEPEHIGVVGDSALVLALDRDSVREKDRDGRLRIAVSNITKANVCPYRGNEIPGWQALGLDPDKIYNLLRDPDELAKAAKSLNGVPLLRKHIAVSAEDHQPHDVVGSLGTDAKFDGTYLTNSLFVNAKDAIDDIETGHKRELSAGYHYTPDMTPGKFGGKGYDGVMRDIVFNHVALVEDGRAGPDVIVGDSAENIKMKTTRIATLALSSTALAITPLLAMDSKVALPKDIFAKLTTKNFKDQKAALLAGIRSAIEGKLRPGMALDASMEGVAKLIDALEGTATGADEDAPEDDVAKMEDIATVEPAAIETVEPEPTNGFDAEPIKNFLREKGLGEDDINAVAGMLPQAQASDADPDDEGGKKEDDPDKKPPAKDSDMKDVITKPAMDAALKVHGDEVAKRVRENERGIRIALNDVKPYVGELSVDLAFDSAADVHRHALTMLGVDGAKTMHPDALLPVLKSQRKAGDVKAPVRSLAMDSSAIDKAAKFAPGIDRIVIGA